MTTQILLLQQNFYIIWYSISYIVIKIFRQNIKLFINKLPFMFLKSTTYRGGNEVDRANNQMKKNVHWTEYFFFIKFYMDGYICKIIKFQILITMNQCNSCV